MNWFALQPMLQLLPQFAPQLSAQFAPPFAAPLASATPDSAAQLSTLPGETANAETAGTETPTAFADVLNAELATPAPTVPALTAPPLNVVERTRREAVAGAEPPAWTATDAPGHPNEAAAPELAAPLANPTDAAENAETAPGPAARHAWTPLDEFQTTALWPPPRTGLALSLTQIFKPVVATAPPPADSSLAPPAAAPTLWAENEPVTNAIPAEGLTEPLNGPATPAELAETAGPLAVRPAPDRFAAPPPTAAPAGQSEIPTTEPPTVAEVAEHVVAAVADASTFAAEPAPVRSWAKALLPETNRQPVTLPAAQTGHESEIPNGNGQRVAATPMTSAANPLPEMRAQSLNTLLQDWLGPAPTSAPLPAELLPSAQADPEGRVPHEAEPAAAPPATAGLAWTTPLPLPVAASVPVALSPALETESAGPPREPEVLAAAPALEPSATTETATTSTVSATQPWPEATSDAPALARAQAPRAFAAEAQLAAMPQAAEPWGANASEAWPDTSSATRPAPDAPNTVHMPAPAADKFAGTSADGSAQPGLPLQRTVEPEGHHAAAVEPLAAPTTLIEAHVPAAMPAPAPAPASASLEAAAPMNATPPALSAQPGRAAVAEAPAAMPVEEPTFDAASSEPPAAALETPTVPVAPEASSSPRAVVAAFVAEQVTLAVNHVSGTPRHVNETAPAQGPLAAPWLADSALPGTDFRTPFEAAAPAAPELTLPTRAATVAAPPVADPRLSEAPVTRATVVSVEPLAPLSSVTVPGSPEALFGAAPPAIATGWPEAPDERAPLIEMTVAAPRETETPAPAWPGQPAAKWPTAPASTSSALPNALPIAEPVEMFDGSPDANVAERVPASVPPFTSSAVRVAPSAPAEPGAPMLNDQAAPAPELGAPALKDPAALAPAEPVAPASPPVFVTASPEPQTFVAPLSAATPSLVTPEPVSGVRAPLLVEDAGVIVAGTEASATATVSPNVRASMLPLMEDAPPARANATILEPAPQHSSVVEAAPLLSDAAEPVVTVAAAPDVLPGVEPRRAWVPPPDSVADVALADRPAGEPAQATEASFLQPLTAAGPSAAAPVSRDSLPVASLPANTPAPPVQSVEAVVPARPEPPASAPVVVSEFAPEVSVVAETGTAETATAETVTTVARQTVLAPAPESAASNAPAAESIRDVVPAPAPVSPAPRARETFASFRTAEAAPAGNTHDPLTSFTTVTAAPVQPPVEQAAPTARPELPDNPPVVFDSPTVAPERSVPVRAETAPITEDLVAGARADFERAVAPNDLAPGLAEPAAAPPRGGTGLGRTNEVAEAPSAWRAEADVVIASPFTAPNPQPPVPATAWHEPHEPVVAPLPSAPVLASPAAPVAETRVTAVLPETPRQTVAAMPSETPWSPATPVNVPVVEGPGTLLVEQPLPPAAPEPVVTPLPATNPVLRSTAPPPATPLVAAVPLPPDAPTPVVTPWASPTPVVIAETAPPASAPVEVALPPTAPAPVVTPAAPAPVRPTPSAPTGTSAPNRTSAPSVTEAPVLPAPEVAVEVSLPVDVMTPRAEVEPAVNVRVNLPGIFAPVEPPAVSGAPEETAVRFIAEPQVDNETAPPSSVAEPAQPAAPAPVRFVAASQVETETEPQRPLAAPQVETTAEPWPAVATAKADTVAAPVRFDAEPVLASATEPVHSVASLNGEAAGQAEWLSRPSAVAASAPIAEHAAAPAPVTISAPRSAVTESRNETAPAPLRAEVGANGEPAPAPVRFVAEPQGEIEGASVHFVTPPREVAAAPPEWPASTEELVTEAPADARASEPGVPSREAEAAVNAAVLPEFADLSVASVPPNAPPVQAVAGEPASSPWASVGMLTGADVPLSRPAPMNRVGRSVTPAAALRTAPVAPPASEAEASVPAADLADVLDFALPEVEAAPVAPAAVTPNQTGERLAATENLVTERIAPARLPADAENPVAEPTALADEFAEPPAAARLASVRPAMVAPGSPTATPAAPTEEFEAALQGATAEPRGTQIANQAVHATEPRASHPSTEAEPLAAQLAEPLRQASERLTAQTSHTFRVHLSPRELGEVEVELTRDAAGQLHARLTVESDRTQEVLRAELGHLRETLEQAGWPVAQLDVSTGQHGAQQPPPQEAFPEPAAHTTAPGTSTDATLERGGPQPAEDRLLNLHA